MALFLAASIILTLAGCSGGNGSTDYAEAGNWAYAEMWKDGRADVFFVCPTVYSGGETQCNMPLSDTESKADFLGATNMEKGIYDDEARFFAPYYCQAGLNVYALPAEEQEAYLDLAYSDVSAAFTYYLEHYNDGRPIVLAGFSQGADMCIRLLKEYFDVPEIGNLLVACYAVGWRVTEEEMAEYPHLKFAAGEADTGVIVSFNSEAADIDNSLIIPKGTKTLAINPLSWSTGSDPADKSLNKGACFTDYDGNIVTELPELTGCYIDPERGALKVTDVSAGQYPARLELFENGIYHLYDYQFFYRNLEENVKTRIEQFERRLPQSCRLGLR